jgi:hypothetical protein
MHAQRGMALSALVLATLVACGQAFTATGPGDGGGGEAGSSGGEGGSSGSEAAAGDTSGHDIAVDGIAHDVLAIDGPAPHDAPADVRIGDVVVGSTKLVFVSSITFIGNLSGLDGADTKCQSLASAAHLSGTFKAWLSSTTLSAGARLTHSTVPYVLVSGTQVAADWAALTSGTLAHAIDVNEMGGSAPASNLACGGSAPVPAAWTSTAPDGTLDTDGGATCADWMTSGVSYGAGLGVANQTGPAWTQGCGQYVPGGTSTICAAAAALYCIEQ